MIVVKIINHKNDREFSGRFETQAEAENWVKNHSAKGADERIRFAPQKIHGADVLEEVDTAFGKTYKLRFPAEYTVEYLDYDPYEIENNWKAFKAARKEILSDTDWTQLPDVEINTKTRTHYREYRKYVRRKKKDYTDETIHRWNILTFLEYKNKFFLE